MRELQRTARWAKFESGGPSWQTAGQPLFTRMFARQPGRPCAPRAGTSPWPKAESKCQHPRPFVRGPGVPHPPGPHPGHRPSDSTGRQILPPRARAGSPSSTSFPLPLRFPPSPLRSSPFLSLTLSSQATAPPPNP